MAYPQRSWLGLGLGVPGWICVGLIAVGIAIGAAGITTLQQGWALSFGGTETAGQVTDLATSQHSCGKDDMDRCTSYLVTYVFEVGGRQVTGTATVAASFYNGLTVGQTHPVRYVAADPSVSEIDAGITLIGAVFQALLALVFIVVAGGVLAWRMRGAWRMVHLRNESVMRWAEVLTCAPNNVKINNVPQYVITWRDEAGGMGKSRGHKQGDLPEVGSRIAVYADPDSRWPAVWEGDCGTR